MSDNQTTGRRRDSPFPRVAGAAEQLWNLRCNCEHPDKRDWSWHAITQHHPEIAKEYLETACIILTAAERIFD
jgi:hypothetical protein